MEEGKPARGGLPSYFCFEEGRAGCSHWVIGCDTDLGGVRCGVTAFWAAPLRLLGKTPRWVLRRGGGSGGRAGAGGCERAGAGRTPGAAALPPERAAPAPLTRSKINMSVRGCHLVKGVLGEESISL